MPETKLNVQLLTYTQNPIAVIYAAARQCYSASFAGQLYEHSGELEKQEAFVKKIVAAGHESPLEHVNLTFAIEGISRATSHQLVRHRIASYSQQSQRYVKENDFDYIIPPTIKKDETARKRFEDFMKTIQTEYSYFLEYFKEHSLEGEKATQDARFVLPNAAETKIVVTMNCRELLHFFSLRCCVRSQWEIFAMATAMLDLAKNVVPCIFSEAGAKCEQLKFCPESEKFSCGRYPTK